MNTYIMCATSTGEIICDILCKNLKIKGIICLNSSVGNKVNEYLSYSNFCKKNNMECIELETYNFSSSEDKERINNLDIDLIIVASWQRLIPDWLINKCSLGVIGSHGSPEGITMGRGRSPQNWAIILGCNEFWISIFWISSGIDDGEVIESRKFELKKTDDIKTSYIKVNLCVADMIVKNYSGKIKEKKGVVQQGEPRYLPQRIREDGRIDWNRSSDDIYDMIRALTRPYPGAYSVNGTNEFVIWRAKPIMMRVESCDENPGTVISIIEGGFLVKCGIGVLFVEECSNQDCIYVGMKFESVNYKRQLTDIVNRHYHKYNLTLSHLLLDELEE